MSSLVVRVRTIDEIRPHGNADTIELAIVGGWQTVVRKGEFQPGDNVVYIPPDSILPLELSEKRGVTKYLSNGRVRVTRLRGENSQGLIFPAEPEWEVEQDVAEHLGIVKYEPPLKFTIGDCEVDHPLFPRYTDIENIRNFPDVLNLGEPVWVSEKLDGTNSRVGFVGGQWMAGSHNY